MFQITTLAYLIDVASARTSPTLLLIDEDWQPSSLSDPHYGTVLNLSVLNYTIFHHQKVLFLPLPMILGIF